MQALIFGLVFPIVPLLLWKCYRTDSRKETISGGDLAIRYGLYTLVIQLMTTFVMVFLCDPGTSLWEKADTSPSFTLKLAVVELAAALIAAAAEWLYVTRKVRIRVIWQEYRDMGPVRFVRKYIFPCALYLTTVAVVLLNVSLMFDNVLWGDECFSANTAQKDVDGILQVMYFWDNHPPLHYYWTKLFGELLGHTGWVYHLASLTPFFIGLILALTLFRKHFGKIPTAFFIIITGVASSCIRYNLEIRMYSLAFLCVACCYYCAYRVVSGGKAAWIGMVLWGLAGAYSHYYAMMTAGVMIFVTGVSTAVRFKGKTWIKSLLALMAYILGYVPWFPYLFHGTSSVSNNWWMSDIMGLPESMQMILGGVEYEKIIAALLVVFLAALLLDESSFFRLKKTETGTELEVHRPVLKMWSDETYGAAIGVLSIVGTLIAAYLLCLVVGPVLTGRYLYPVSAITVLLLVISGAGTLHLVRKLGEGIHRKWPETLAKVVLSLVLIVLFVTGVGNYRAFRAEVMWEKERTEEVLSLIGEVPDDTALVSNQVKHLTWTVLYYYYPHRDIIAGRCSDEGAEYRKFWYFTPEAIGKSELQEMDDMGYHVESYGMQQIATYPFELYYFEKKE